MTKNNVLLLLQLVLIAQYCMAFRQSTHYVAQLQQQAILKAQVEQLPSIQLKQSQHTTTNGYIYMKPKVPFNADSGESLNDNDKAGYKYPRPEKVFSYPLHIKLKLTRS